MKAVYTLVFIFSTFLSFAQEDTIIYPPAPKADIKDTIWGCAVLDSYRGLEFDTKERQEWLKSEKKLSDNYFKKNHHQYDVEFNYNQVFHYSNIPQRSGPYYLEFSYGIGGINVYYKDYLRDKRTFLCSSSIISSKAKSLSSVKFSTDGKYCAFMYSIDGSDWQEIKVLNVSNSLWMKDHIFNVRYSNITWYHDGFFYDRFDSVDKQGKYTDIEINQKVYYHKIGTSASADSIVFEDKDNPYNTFTTKVTGDERFIIIQEFFPEENKSLTFYKDSNKNSPFKVLFGESNSNTSFIGSIGDTLLAISTKQDAYNGQIVEIDTKNPKSWSIVVENQKKYSMKSVLYVKDKYFVIFKEGFKEYICLFSRTGDIIKTLLLSEGSANDIICYSPDQDGVIIAKNYYTNPPNGELFSLKDYSLKPIDKTGLNYNPLNYRFYLTNYHSRDGTLIPIYIVMSKDYIHNGPSAALLNVYGGFSISPLPRFDPGIFTFLNNGGIYAVANIRGGSNSIKGWHESGSVLNKQNAIDDAYYAARFLVDSGFALSEKIAITGSSNGGMVAAAVINQHPEMFRAAILSVGIYDMIRYENFTAGIFWNTEYGSVYDSLQFKNLLSYSPLHNVKANVTYPSMLITTSDHDDRVPPLHSYKYVAALQDITHSKNPILLFVNKDQGHNSLNNKYFYSFIFKELDLKYKPMSYYKDK